LAAHVDPPSTGDSCSLASRRIQIVLEVDIPAADSRWEKMREQAIARTDLSHGRREPNLGRTAHSWGTKMLSFDIFRAHSFAVDEKGAQKFWSSNSMAGVSEQSS